MVARRTWVVLLGAAALAGGCNEGAPSGRPDALAPADVAPPTDSAAADSVSQDTRSVMGPLPIPTPPIHPGAIRFGSAGAELVGGLDDGCSHGAGPARWCAFAQIGSYLGRRELWVVDTSQLPVPCDGTSPHCLRLTDDLSIDRPRVGPAHPTVHRFFGDTLVFLERSDSRPVEVYAGRIHAWRPGWPAARPISAGAAARTCIAHTGAPLAFCLENVAGEDSSPLRFDLHAGNFAAGSLPRIATIHAGPLGQWRAGFSHDGRYFFYLAARPPVAPATAWTPETLHVLESERLGQEAPRPVGPPGLSRVTLTDDGRRVFYLRDLDRAAERPAGTLAMADFPSGAGEAALVGGLLRAGAVVDYRLVEDRTGRWAWIAVLQRGAGPELELVLITDPAGALTDPSNVVRVASGVLDLPIDARDLRYGYLPMAPATPSGGEVRIQDYRQGSSCAFSGNTLSAAFGPPFTPDSGVVVYAQNHREYDGTADGMVVSAADCMTHRRQFADRVDRWVPWRADQLLYTDGVVRTRATLRLARTAEGALGPGEILQAGIDRHFGVVGAEEAVLFSLQVTDAEVSGLYYLNP